MSIRQIINRAFILRHDPPNWEQVCVGNFFPPHTSPGDFLRLYSQKLTTVEGNTTFYALPSAETVARWSQETPSYFRFCPKISRDISHSAALDARARRAVGTHVSPAPSRLFARTNDTTP